jgi:hypothetical protein
MNADNRTKGFRLYWTWKSARLKVSDRRIIVSSTETASNTTAPTQYLAVADNTYAHRQFGSGHRSPAAVPAAFHRHTRQLGYCRHRPSRARSVILFESAGIGRSSGKVPETPAGMAAHAVKFLDALGLT